MLCTVLSSRVCLCFTLCTAFCLFPWCWPVFKSKNRKVSCMKWEGANLWVYSEVSPPIFAEITLLVFAAFMPSCQNGLVSVGSWSAGYPKMGLMGAAGLARLSRGVSLSSCLSLFLQIDGGWVPLSSDLKMFLHYLLGHWIIFIEGLCGWEHAAAVTSYIYSFSIERLSTPVLM